MTRTLFRTTRVLALIVPLLLFAAMAGAQQDLVYRVDYEARIVPTEGAAHVSVRVTDPKGLLKKVNWRIDPERHRDFEGGGTVEVNGSSVLWTPTPGVTTLRYVFRIDHLRNERSYDSRCAESWAIFRGDDLVPPVEVRTKKLATSDARLILRLPDGWSSATAYARGSNGVFLIDNPHRRFDRPTGWMAVGRLGVLRETVAGTHLAIAGPVGQRLHRSDILAFLRWNLPALRSLIGELPGRMLVVGAGDPMWRGGLSGPRSAYIHASRPLISEDGTSPVLHELVHSALGLAAGPGGDWIVEGLAEYYSLEALVRSRTVSRKRHAKALDKIEVRGRQAGTLAVAEARGEVTALGVTVLRALDAEIRARTQDQRGIEDAVRILVASRPAVTTAELQAAAEEVSGADLSAFFRRTIGRAR